MAFLSPTNKSLTFKSSSFTLLFKRMSNTFPLCSKFGDVNIFSSDAVRYSTLTVDLLPKYNFPFDGNSITS